MAWWFPGDHRRGPHWKQDWKIRALSSATLPPLPLVAILAIVLLLMSLSGYVDYKEQVRRTAVGFQLVLFLLPVLLLMAAVYVFHSGRFVLNAPWRLEQHRAAVVDHRAVGGSGGQSPWGVAAVVLVLLLMVSYQSYFHSQWFPGLWRSGY